MSNLDGLTPNTTYFVRAYAVNSADTAYGNGPWISPLKMHVAGELDPIDGSLTGRRYPCPVRKQHTVYFYQELAYLFRQQFTFNFTRYKVMGINCSVPEIVTIL